MSIKVLEFILLSVLLAFLFMPVDARINFNYTLNYDHDGTSQYFGEEIRVKLVIDPGANEVRDMRIDILEDEALIDDTSFEEAKYPAGAPVNITRVGHTFFCDRLGVGESIALMFNAYPKTEMREEINVADVHITYTQLGERLENKEKLKARIADSYYFKLEKAEEEINRLKEEISSMESGMKMAKYVGVMGFIFILICAFFVFLWYNEKKRRSIYIGEKLYDFCEFLEGIKKEIKEPDLRRRIEDYENDIKMRREYQEYEGRKSRI